MTTLPKPKIDAFTLEVPSLSRDAIEELYNFLQYLQFRHEIDLDTALEAIEDEIDPYDAEIALQEPGDAVPLGNLEEGTRAIVSYQILFEPAAARDSSESYLISSKKPTSCIDRSVGQILDHPAVGN